MSSLDDQKTFEKYYQRKFDFDTTALSQPEIDEIKQLVKEKRVNYAIAPIGENIFDFITEMSPLVHLELAEFSNDQLDGMLYIPNSEKDNAYIIINGLKPLINQIFTAAHEYYHYLKDYQSLKEQPYICKLSSLQNINEKRASRFAAEFLLPEEALLNEIKILKRSLSEIDIRKDDFIFFATLSILLTVKYQLPLKSVLYRLHEEKWIIVDKYIDQYAFIKKSLIQLKLFEEDIAYLYSPINKHIDNANILYPQIEKAYTHGLVSREEIHRDAKTLHLRSDIIESFFSTLDDDRDDVADDEEMLEKIKNSWEAGKQ